MRGTEDPVSTIARVMRGFVMPTLGMAFYWAYMRYQNFFMILYPRDAMVTVGSASLPVHATFLVALLVISAAGLMFWRPIEHAIEHHRVGFSLLTLAGSVGAALAIAMRLDAPPDAGTFWLVCEWASATLVALGFLASLLIWASYFSATFSARELLVIATSYLVSLVVFRNAGYQLQTAQVVTTVAVPIGSGVFWLLSERSPHDLSTDESAAGFRGLANPTVWLFVAFLLAGSIIRGVVDTMEIHPSYRHVLSVPIAALLTALCAAYVYAHRHNRDAGTNPFVLWCWIAFSTLFFVGVFLILALDDLNLGGSVVVIARSMLGVCFWMLLCDLAHRRAVAFVPLFLICEAMVEGVSWLLSYVIVPVYATGWSAGDPAPTDTLVLLAVFALIAIVTIACGFLLVLAGRRNSSIAAGDWIPVRPSLDDPADVDGARVAPHTPGSSDAHGTSGTSGASDTHGASEVQGTPATPSEARPLDGDELLAQRLVEQFGLTPREAAVAVRYARGYSLAKVSEELGITNSAAQSHIKLAYRKLDVHTKNKLIEVTDSLRG